MLYILFNPLARNCIKEKQILKVEKKASKYFKTSDTKKVSLLEIKDYDRFINQLKNEDIVLILGGDGTLHNIVNKVNLDDYPHDNIYLIKSGTGNDFLRSLKERKKKFIKITKYLKNLPTANINGKSLKFLNGIGIGLDGFICYLVEEQKKEKSKGNFLKIMNYAFKRHKKFPLTITVDGKTHTFKDVWFCAVMNSKYFGRGMKVSPNSNREKPELRAIVIHKASKVTFFFKMLYIYSTGILKFKKFVSELVGSDIKVEAEIPQHVQVDGEVISNVENFNANK